MGNNSQRVWWLGLSLWVLGSLALAGIVHAQNAVSFLARRDFRVPSPSSITVGDFNGDGRLDLATANERANSVSILINAAVSARLYPFTRHKTPHP